MNTTRLWLHLRTAFLCAAFAICSAESRASGPRADVAELLKSIPAVPREEAYVAVRELWAMWGETEPMSVELGLQKIAESSQVAAPVRAYAGFFSSRARARRGDLAGARLSARELGFVDQWLVVGPFDNEGKAGFETEFGPEAQVDQELLPGRVFSGKERPVSWRATPEGAFPYGYLDGDALFRPDQHICYFATTFVSLEKEGPVSLWVGNSGAIKLFLNGVVVLADPAVRGYDVDRHGVLVRLPAGTNRLTAKVCGSETAPMLSLRVASPTGAPLTEGVAVSAAFERSSDAVSNAHQATLLDAGLGPLARFSKRIQARRVRPSAKEAFARYLVESNGDDPAIHQARDLARDAAEAEPTVRRLLLAGELAEDYNHARTWIERAEAMPENDPRQQAEVLLARARIERGGLNWRDAFPYYKRALDLDPTSYDALQGTVESYNEGGLRYTALQLLEASIRRQPNAVNVLNMYTSQLRALGHHGQADRNERRYERLRFDDTTHLNSRLELALAQQDRAAAEHWTERLLELAPENLWAHAVAARAYQQLGQPERARTTYERALSLAPEDVSVLRALSDLHGEQGERDEQLRLLRTILALRPQAKDVREYVEHVEPEQPRADEAYAWKPERFLKKRNADADGETRRSLVDLTVTTVYANGLSSQFRQVVFQPLNDSAAALSRRYVFAYQADSQRVELRGARVYRADGGIDEAVETGTDSADDPSIAMYTSARTFYVQFPRLDPGDVVELTYRIDTLSGRNEYDDYFGAVEVLQSSEPVGYAEYVLITPKSRVLNIDARGIPGLQQKTQATSEQNIYRFWAEDLKAIVPEPAMPPWGEVAGHIHVSTFEDYRDLGRWYWGLIRDQFDLDAQTRLLAADITRGAKTEREKVAAVYNWVINNTRYVALEFGIYGHKPRRCVQTVARGWGDCKDKATVLVTLLKELGIDAKIVVVRTQMRGRFISDVASLAPFDHAIAYVPSLDLYLDGTAEYTGIEELPAMDQEALAIIVDQGDSKVVTLPLLAHQTRRETLTKAKLNSNGSGSVELAATVTGASAPEWRRRYAAVDKRRERVVYDVSQIIMGFELNAGPAAVSVAAEDFEQPVRVRAVGKTDTLARVDGTRLTLPVTVRRRLADQYASLAQRKLDVRLPVFGTEHSVYEVELPPGMQVLAGPEDVSVTTAFGDFSIKSTQSGRVVRVESALSLKTTRVSPQEYTQWRKFCRAADAAMSVRLEVGTP